MHATEIGVALLVGMFVTAACTGEDSHPPTTAPLSRIASGFVAVPDVIGLSTAGAVAAMDQAGLAFEINPVGGTGALVLKQDPRPGTSVRIGATIVLDASCLPAPCPRPTGNRIYDPCTCAAR